MANSATSQSNASGTPNFVIGLPSTNVQINGSIDGGNPEVSFYLDGGLNISGIRNYGNQLPNPDALDEFRVETSEFSAQYGHMSAAVVTAVTKSGTNQFHGSLFEFNRNTDFNARTVGNSAQRPYHRNNFGGVIRGSHQARQGIFPVQLRRPAPGRRISAQRGVMPTAPNAWATSRPIPLRSPRPAPRRKWIGTNSSQLSGGQAELRSDQALLDPDGGADLERAKAIR